MTGAALQPDFPPLLTGLSVGLADPFAAALAQVQSEVEPGLVHYAETEDVLRAAVTLAPEEPLRDAIGAVMAVQLGLADSLGSLAPPEVAVQFGWPDVLRVNGAMCGRFRAIASTRDPEIEPDWLVVGIEVNMQPKAGEEPGATPDTTTLFAEGCGDITAPMLIEAWARHMLLWIHHYLNDGLAPLHAHWRGKCDKLGAEVTTPEAGTFVGLDARGGMLLRQGTVTKLLPLTTILEGI